MAGLPKQGQKYVEPGLKIGFLVDPSSGLLGLAAGTNVKQQGSRKVQSILCGAGRVLQQQSVFRTSGCTAGLGSAGRMSAVVLKNANSCRCPPVLERQNSGRAPESDST